MKTARGIKITIFTSLQGRPGQALLTAQQISILSFFPPNRSLLLFREGHVTHSGEGDERPRVGFLPHQEKLLHSDLCPGCGGEARGAVTTFEDKDRNYILSRAGGKDGGGRPPGHLGAATSAWHCLSDLLL